jgi:crotonobetainyl-CoA:carnitine CoA-transferase CaiB-like acyl-CoA transferase
MSEALSTIKILDFTTLLPGPYATMFLGDLGADVLRIVSASRPDLVNFLPPFIPDIDLSAASAQLGRNKRVLPLNLKDERAVEIIHKLIATYDIIIEQFRPGVMAKLNLDYESLAAINPSIIYCSLSGFGQTGSMRDRAGHDINYIARSGIASYSGRKDTGPSLLGTQIADIAAGSNHAVIGILAAVIYRQATGIGQFIDTSMTDGMIALNAMVGAGFLADNKNPDYEDNILNGGSIYDYYKTKDGQYISVGCLEPKFFSNFCEAINRPDLEQEGVSPKNIKRIKKEVSEILVTKTRDEWMAIFNKTDACVEPVLSLSEVFTGKLVKEREMVVDVPLPNGGKVNQIANPIRFSETPQEYKFSGVPPHLGHTKEVLTEIGYKEEEINEFEKTGLFS